MLNIKEAKIHIQNAMKAYLTKDEFGGYVVPLEKQRPIFLMGPPGVGKTAIMQQIALELGVGFVSYSMTHHTRQSALGLPFINGHSFSGQNYQVSEYTMSEIVAAVYKKIEQTGLAEGILFLDEVNCVSETLTPSMLQFLQYKVFGTHRIPDGWIVVTAGNPPEYNQSVREFDVVTWDRLRRIDVIPDYAVWKEFASKAAVHPAVLSYLDTKKANFYRIEEDVDGSQFATARGWSDLSDMLYLYEQHEIRIDENLVGQYIQHKKIIQDFAVFYDLYIKYKEKYQTDVILAGEASAALKTQAKKAPVDEQFAVVGLLADALAVEMRELHMDEDVVRILRHSLSPLLKISNCTLGSIQELIEQSTANLKEKIRNETIGKAQAYAERKAIDKLKQYQHKCAKGTGSTQNIVKAEFNLSVDQLKKRMYGIKEQLANAFRFCEEAFNGGDKPAYLATALSTNYYCATFISRYGCPEYQKHSKGFLIYDKKREIMKELENFI